MAAPEPTLPPVGVSMSETASLLAEHLYRGSMRDNWCSCGKVPPALILPRLPSNKGGVVIQNIAAAHRAHLAAIIDAHFAERERALVERVEAASDRPTPEDMSEGEGDAWDQLHDDSDIICTCDGCNYYSPTYDAERACSLNVHIEAVVAARLRAALARPATEGEGA